MCLNHDLLTFVERALFTCGSTPLLLLSMLIKFLCSLIKRIEFASAAGCYMASWKRARTRIHTQTNMRTQQQAHISRVAMHTLIHPSWQLVNCQGVNWKWWCNCIRVLIYPGLLFIYLAVDFKTALIVSVSQRGARRGWVLVQICSRESGDCSVRCCKRKVTALRCYQGG